MIKADIVQLITAVHEAPSYENLETSQGTSYLLENVYERLLYGEDIRLSDLDLTAFEAEDVNAFHDLFTNIISMNSYQAGAITEILRKIAPVHKDAVYV